MALSADTKMGRQDPDFKAIKEELSKVGLVFQASVPDRDNAFIVIAWHPVKGTFSTHATAGGNTYLIWGHYDIGTFEEARKDALERAW